MLRRMFIAGLAVACILAFSLTADAGPTVSDVVNSVSQSHYTTYHGNLYVQTGSRQAGSTTNNHDPAKTYIYDTFTGLGLSTSYDAGSDYGYNYVNVVASKTGTVRPNDIYVVGAHYDSVNCPGADDNASGTAGVLELARVFSQYQFEATMVFIAFDQEETGLHGSSGYAGAHAGDNIKGMVSLDMIAYNYNGNNDKAQVDRGGSDATVQDGLLAAISAYSGGLTGINGGQGGGSDHAPFAGVGKPSALLIEDWSHHTPYYHTTSDSVDTPGNIDYPFATRMVRSAAGYFAEAAVPVPEPATAVLLVLGAAACLLRRPAA